MLSVGLHLPGLTYRRGGAGALGPFDPAFAAWQLGAGDDLTAEDAGDGRITLVRGSGSIAAGGFWQAFLTEIGKTYRFTGAVVTASMSIRFGTSPGNGSLLGQNTSVGAFDWEFTATGETTFISLWPVNTSTTASIEDMALEEVVPE